MYACPSAVLGTRAALSPQNREAGRRHDGGDDIPAVAATVI